MIELKHDKDYYLKFVLVFIIIFFTLTYVITHRNTISKEFEVIGSGSTYFAKYALIQVFDLNDRFHTSRMNRETFEIETQVFDLINQIREENNLEPLMWDPMLAQLAREHSFDMATNDYFNHTSLSGLDTNQRAQLIGLSPERIINGKKYEGIGENIGLMPKGIVAETGVLILPEDISSAMVLRWMLSPPHKRNILTPSYRYTGIGVIYDGTGNYYLTQNFQ